MNKNISEYIPENSQIVEDQRPFSEDFMRWWNREGYKLNRKPDKTLPLNLLIMAYARKAFNAGKEINK